MQSELFQSSKHQKGLTHWQPNDWPVSVGWRDVIAEFLNSDAGLALAAFVKARINAGAVIYPPTPFKALEMTPLDQVRVVILGQDPYHEAGQAQGLAFSVATGVKVPPSLRNIFKEIGRETGDATISSRKDGSLLRWAEQGVLLLNTCLTVEEGAPASHAKLGWEGLTDALIALVAESNKNVVFMLWGAHAQAKQTLLETPKSQANKHFVLCANHPSPLSAMRPPAPFLGCGHFGLANAYLAKYHALTINW